MAATQKPGRMREFLGDRGIGKGASVYRQCCAHAWQAASGSESSEGQQWLGVFMAQGLSIASRCEVRFRGGIKNRQALNG